MSEQKIDWTKPIEVAHESEPTKWRDAAYVGLFDDVPVVGWRRDNCEMRLVAINGPWRARNKPKEIVAYLNVYDNEGMFVYRSRSGADIAAGDSVDRVACKRVVITHGEFDE